MPTGTDLGSWLDSRRVAPNPVQTSEIVGIGHVLTHCESLVGRLLDEARHGAAASLPPVRSMLFVGPPGSGKTLTSRWILGQLGPVPAYDLPTEQLDPQQIRSTFAHLGAQPRSVVFMPEIDVIGVERRDSDRQSRARLFALLEALDGLAPVDRVEDRSSSRRRIASCGNLTARSFGRVASEASSSSSDCPRGRSGSRSFSGSRTRGSTLSASTSNASPSSPGIGARPTSEERSRMRSVWRSCGPGLHPRSPTRTFSLRSAEPGRSKPTQPSFSIPPRWRSMKPATSRSRCPWVWRLRRSA